MMKLSVYDIDGDTAIAYNEEDAYSVMAEYEGITVAESKATRENAIPTITSDDAVITVRSDEDGSDTTLTAAQWVAREGRGFLCSTNF